MLYTLLATISFALQNYACKEFGRRFSQNLAGLALMNLLALSLVCMLMAALGGAQIIAAGALWTALLFGVGFVATIFLIMESMATGPLGLSVLIINASLLIPALWGLFFWRETLTWIKAAGIALILLLLWLTAAGGQTAQRSRRWLGVTLGAFLFDGLLGILQHDMAAYPAISSAALTFWTSLFSAAVCALILLICRLRGQRLAPFITRPLPLLACSAGVGLGTAGGNLYSILALTVIPGIVMFPLRQGLLVLLMWALGILLYREQVGRRGWLILLSGLAGLILVSIG